MRVVHWSGVVSSLLALGCPDPSAVATPVPSTQLPTPPPPPSPSHPPLECPVFSAHPACEAADLPPCTGNRASSGCARADGICYSDRPLTEVCGGLTPPWPARERVSGCPDLRRLAFEGTWEVDPFDTWNETTLRQCVDASSQEPVWVFTLWLAGPVEWGAGILTDPRPEDQALSKAEIYFNEQGRMLGIRDRMHPSSWVCCGPGRWATSAVQYGAVPVVDCVGAPSISRDDLLATP